MRLLSAEAQRLAPPGSTYGYDVLVRLDWQRQHQHATYREIHHDLPPDSPSPKPMCAISISTCIYPSSRATNVSSAGGLARAAQEQGGLIIALDGLAPQGGEPQIWFIRDLSTGLTLRSGWLAQLDQPTLRPSSPP